jgi:hypothetical protein
MGASQFNVQPRLSRFVLATILLFTCFFHFLAMNYPATYLIFFLDASEHLHSSDPLLGCILCVKRVHLVIRGSSLLVFWSTELLQIFEFWYSVRLCERDWLKVFSFRNWTHNLCHTLLYLMKRQFKKSCCAVH